MKQDSSDDQKKTAEPSPWLVTRKQAARMLGVSEITMRRCDGKRIEPIRLTPNGKVFYRVADLLSLIKPNDSG